MQHINNPLSVGLLTGLSMVVGTSASTSVSAAMISDSEMFSTSDSLMVFDDGSASPTTDQNTVNQVIQLRIINYFAG